MMELKDQEQVRAPNGEDGEDGEDGEEGEDGEDGEDDNDDSEDNDAHVIMTSSWVYSWLCANFHSEKPQSVFSGKNLLPLSVKPFYYNSNQQQPNS